MPQDYPEIVSFSGFFVLNLRFWVLRSCNHYKIVHFRVFTMKNKSAIKREMTVKAKIHVKNEFDVSKFMGKNTVKLKVFIR